MGQGGGEVLSRHPQILWAQRSETVYLTVELPDAKNPQVKLEPDGRFKFSAMGGGSSSDNESYEADLELYGKVDVEGSKINVGPRHILCEIEKGEEGWWKRLLKQEGKAPAYVRADWNRWVDEDEEEEEDELRGRGMDGSEFTSFGGDSDEEEDEELPDTSKVDEEEKEEEISNANKTDGEKEEELPDTNKTDDDEEEVPKAEV
jgi:prostaglandin-E synthase